MTREDPIATLTVSRQINSLYASGVGACIHIVPPPWLELLTICRRLGLATNELHLERSLAHLLKYLTAGCYAARLMICSDATPLLSFCCPSLRPM